MSVPRGSGRGVARVFTCRRARGRWVSLLIAGLIATLGGMPQLTPTASAQTAPVGAGFRIDAGDLRFIFHAIEVAQDHAAGGTLLGPGPNQVNLFGVPNAQLPIGLRTVDGSYNNLVPVPD